MKKNRKRNSGEKRKRGREKGENEEREVHLFPHSMEQSGN
jgi:hypothetical protein